MEMRGCLETLKSNRERDKRKAESENDVIMVGPFENTKMGLWRIKRR